jgi:hypothetical protein
MRVETRLNMEVRTVGKSGGLELKWLRHGKPALDMHCWALRGLDAGLVQAVSQLFWCSAGWVRLL